MVMQLINSMPRDRSSLTSFASSRVESAMRQMRHNVIRVIPSQLRMCISTRINVSVNVQLVIMKLRQQLRKKQLAYLAKRHALLVESQRLSAYLALRNSYCSKRNIRAMLR